jgi:hypothetical protein
VPFWVKPAGFKVEEYESVVAAVHAGIFSRTGELLKSVANRRWTGSGCPALALIISTSGGVDPGRACASQAVPRCWSQTSVGSNVT